jgi:amino acid adenylation domain-containing protein
MNTQGTESFFLSPQQKRIWLDQIGNQPGNQPANQSGCATVQAMLRIPGPLDADRLRIVLKQAMARHEILRTVFVRPPGMRVPFQSVLESGELGWEVREAAPASSSSSSGEEAVCEEDATLAAHRAAQGGAGFDLDHGPMLRALLLRGRSGEGVLIVTAPALSLDAHSMENLAAEVMRGYRGDAPLPGEPVRYIQFAQWQNDLLESAAEENPAAVAYWSKSTCDPAAVSLPFSEISDLEAGAAADSGVVSRALDAASVEQLEASATGMGATLRSVLFAAWQVVLWRISGQAQLRTLVAFDGRDHEELRAIMGPVSRLLPIVTELEAGFSFRVWVGKVQRALDQAAAWQEYFDPAAHRPPEPPIVFEFRSLDGDAGKEEAAEFAELVDVSAGWSGAGLILRCVRGGGLGLRLELGWEGGRYGGAGVERLLGHLVVLLESAVGDGEQRVGDLPLLGAGEQAELFGLWRGGAAELPERSVGELITEQAGRTPERSAVRCGESRLSYAELDRAGRRLAQRLRGLGVAQGSLVGLLLERSVGMVVGVLGVLEAGGAYVPLSAEQPAARLERQLAGVAVLVTERRLAERVPAMYGGQVVWLEELGEGEADAAPAGMVAARELGPEDLAYVMYTSGSTGEPKGVEVTHGNLVNYCASIAGLLRLEEERSGLCFAMVSTLGADLGHTCLYPALLSGGTVDVVPYAVATDGEQMARYVEQHGVDVLKIVPSHLESLLATGGARVLPRRYLITGGEGLRPALVEAVEQSGAGCRMINHYGPTETTVGSLVLELERGERWTGATVPIGRPLGNTEVYVLDPRGQVCPAGVAGELYIGGAGVTRGYRNRPELTAERFVADRFSGRPGARLYRTGDRVRSDAEGRIEYLGRLDDQVKIRGYRVEPGEVAGVLERQPEVRQAVVVAGEDGRGQVSLTGYVVARAGQAGAGRELGGELEARLRAELPEYMVPQAVVVLARLPLTANGKLDRAALPRPEAVARESYQPPQSPTEQLVAGIWAEVLKVPRVGLNDDFFLLGGHSLLATQVIARIRERSGAEIALRSLFEQPTLSRFATAVDGSPRRESPADGPIRRAPRNTYQPLRAEVPQ